MFVITSYGMYLVVRAAIFSVCESREVFGSLYLFEKCLAPSRCRLVRAIEEMHNNSHQIDDAKDSRASSSSKPTLALVILLLICLKSIASALSTCQDLWAKLPVMSFFSY